MEIFVFLLLLAAAGAAKASKEEPELNLNQNDYEMKFERVELVRYNKNYMDISLRTYKFNRTQPAVNTTVTFKIDVNYNFRFTVQAYKFMSNEYREFPLRFAASACKAINANAGGANRFMACGNFTGCPIVKGQKYHICNFYPDQSKFPPFMPNGEFKLEFEFESQSKELYVLAAYITIYRPVKYIPKKLN